MLKSLRPGVFHHTVLPFRRVKAGPWAVICLECCTTTNGLDMTQTVAKVSETHRGEIRVFSPMEVVATKSRTMLG
jgi:hypothetical protein